MSAVKRKFVFFNRFKKLMNSPCVQHRRISPRRTLSHIYGVDLARLLNLSDSCSPVPPFCQALIRTGCRNLESSIAAIDQAKAQAAPFERIDLAGLSTPLSLNTDGIALFELGRTRSADAKRLQAQRLVVGCLQDICSCPRLFLVPIIPLGINALADIAFMQACNPRAGGLRLQSQSSVGLAIPASPPAALQFAMTRATANSSTTQIKDRTARLELSRCAAWH
jgi:hypothetical protein